MDADVLGIANAYNGLKQMQLQSAIQTHVLRNVMDTQSQMLQELLQGAADTTAVVNHPYLGNHVDVYV
jgi:hypothetical protein